MLSLAQKAKSVLQIGVHNTAEYREFVWFDGQNTPNFLSIRSDATVNPLMQIQQRLDLSRGKTELKFVSSISPHHIWTKSLVLPQQLSAQECERQCRFILQNELPAPLEQVWFDYSSEPLAQGVQLNIFAIMKHIAQAHIQSFQPLKITILDSAAHAVLRAFRYLLDAPDDAVFLYQDETFCLAVQEKHRQIRVLQQTEPNSTALFARFCQHYDETPPQVYVYAKDSAQSAVDKTWKIIETDLPFIALGNALWQQDLLQRA
ncbi:pilus assembly protein PilM [Caviibacterium pharyngocola]|uniref:Competence protein ComA n=1 Tax=Caviibacterium pharyngocola TaxID=28159 RepID=A0A2M8RVQ3_9PAST|nr:pilus assembly protein PilM [Caviibacterium pharyngocola]PJG82962.1 competence protein ComA [Caviibacterium pharyngocola]